MDLLSRLEKALERAVEGAFARTFRARLHPVEIAKRLARQMDANKTVSVSATYMPNRFRVGLSTRDYQEFDRVRDAVLPEMCAYLAEHARRARCSLVGEIEIAAEADDALVPGEVKVETAMVAGEQATSVSPAEPPAAQETAVGVSPPAARLIVDENETPLDQAITRMGRADDNDLVLADRAVSRHHAEIQRLGGQFIIVDMGSKNGTYLNGQRVESAPLRDGDRIQVGPVTLVFRLG